MCECQAMLCSFTNYFFNNNVIIIIIIIIIVIIIIIIIINYSSTCISTLIVFEFLISFLNVCIFSDYVK